MPTSRYDGKDYDKALSYAIQSKKASDKSLSLSNEIKDKIDNGYREMALKKINEAKRKKKNTFEAENYMQQKNYEEAIKVLK